MQLIKDGIKIQSVLCKLTLGRSDTKEDLISSYTTERISLIEKAIFQLGEEWNDKNPKSFSSILQ